MMVRKDELIKQCQFKGIELKEGIRYTRDDLIHKLGDYSLSIGLRENTWALQNRRMLNHPMVCQWYHRLKDNQKETVFEDDNNWVAEQKHNGLRLIVFYHPDFGFQFFSRHNSEKDYLPVEYNNIMLNLGNKLEEAIAFKGKWMYPFIIDTEVITTNKTLDLSVLPKNIKKANMGFGEMQMRSYQIKSELNAACSIVQYNKEDSLILQRQNPLVFQVFDIIMINNMFLYDKALHERLKILGELMKFLPPCFKACPVTNVKKRDYYENIVSEGAEGIVLKNLLSPYNNRGTRHADKWVKLKRSMTGTTCKDIDAFVTGFNRGSGKNENLVGSIEFSVYLRDKNGLLNQHVIANIGGISDEFRKFITAYDENGNPILRPEMYGKVFSIDGHTVSAVNLRFNHAILVNEIPRMDKTAIQCDLDEEVLRRNIL